MFKKFLSGFAILGSIVFMLPVGANAQSSYFSVSIVSTPAASAMTANAFSTLNTKVGDTIEFTAVVTQTAGGYSEAWSYNQNVLSCTTGMDTLSCKTIAEGSANVYTTITISANGQSSKLDSNTIYVNVVSNVPSVSISSNPAAVQTSSSGSSISSLKVGDDVVITMGVPLESRGTTNLMKVHALGSHES